MAQKIKMQKGYPTSDGDLFDKYQDAVAHQAELDLNKAVDKCEGTTTTADFIKENTEVVSEFIKYHGKKKTTKKQKKSKTDPVV